MKKDVVLFFDLFDTLVKVDRGYLEAYFDRETDRLGDIGFLSDSVSTIKRLVSLYPELNGHGFVSDIANDYEESMRKSLMEVPKKVLKMLDNLKSAGYRMCIVSDASYTDILYWDESPLSQYFEKTVFSCERGKTKPRLVQDAWIEMGFPETCFYIGDGGHDELIGAKSVGMKTIKAEWLLNRRLESIYECTDFYAKTPEQLVYKLKNDEFQFYELKGLGELKSITFASCSTEKHAKRAQQMLVSEGGILSEVQTTDKPTRKKTDVLYINGMELGVRPLIY